MEVVSINANVEMVQNMAGGGVLAQDGLPVTASWVPMIFKLRATGVDAQLVAGLLPLLQHTIR